MCPLSPQAYLVDISLVPEYTIKFDNMLLNSHIRNYCFLLQYSPKELELYGDSAKHPIGFLY